jgi:Calcium binding
MTQSNTQEHFVAQRAISPLRPGDEVEECDHEMFVMVRWNAYELAVPLSELQGVDVDEKTQQAIEDWQYWMDQGYEL